MTNIKLKDLKNKLEGKYERTNIVLIPPVLYMYFNDSYDNCIVVSIYNQGDIYIHNIQNLKNENFKTDTIWGDKIQTNNINDLILFFHKCYKRMINDNKNWEQNNKDIIRKLGIDYNKIINFIPIGELMKKLTIKETINKYDLLILE